MAEVFQGKNHNVYTSNGGGEELLKAFVEVSMKMRATPKLKTVRLFLTKQLDRGNGDRAFSLDTDFYFPDIFHNAENLKVFLALITNVGNELALPKPTLNWDISWNRTFRLKWLARMVELYEIVNELIVQHGYERTALPIRLNEEDIILFRYYLISDYYKEACKRQPKDKSNENWKINVEHNKLNLLNELISIFFKIEKGNDVLLLKLWERSEVFISLDRKQEAITDLKKCIQLTSDEKEKDFFNEYINAL